MSGLCCQPSEIETTKCLYKKKSLVESLQTPTSGAADFWSRGISETEILTKYVGQYFSTDVVCFAEIENLSWRLKISDDGTL